MTREDAKKAKDRLYDVPFDYDGDALIDKIFDGFEEEKAENAWHTGTPTEEGDYFVAFRWGFDNKIMHDMASRVLYGATKFVNGNWRIDLPYVVIAWQKIEPYEASTEERE